MFMKETICKVDQRSEVTEARMLLSVNQILGSRYPKLETDESHPKQTTAESHG